MSVCIWFCLIGDFNFTPEEMAEKSAFLQDLDAEVFKPQNAEVTCSSGEGKMLDWGVISKGAKHMITPAQLNYQVPWKPHFAVWPRELWCVVCAEGVGACGVLEGLGCSVDPARRRHVPC